jgi:hypothetical protein
MIRKIKRLGIKSAAAIIGATIGTIFAALALPEIPITIYFGIAGAFFGFGFAAVILGMKNLFKKDNRFRGVKNLFVGIASFFMGMASIFMGIAFINYPVV